MIKRRETHQGTTEARTTSTTVAESAVVLTLALLIMLLFGLVWAASLVGATNQLLACASQLHSIWSPQSFGAVDDSEGSLVNMGVETENDDREQ